MNKCCRYAGPEGSPCDYRDGAAAGGSSRQQASMEANPMLVLTRKSNQSIMIGDDIEVSVLAIIGEKVRIGIQAPREVPVFRKEVYLEIQQERNSGKGARDEVDAALRGLGDT
jgi:carbon storage regulator